jgi:hypothetical protein
VSEDQKRMAIKKLELFKYLLKPKPASVDISIFPVASSIEKVEGNEIDLQTSRKRRRTDPNRSDSDSSSHTSSTNGSPGSQSIWGPVGDSPFGHIPSPPSPNTDDGEPGESDGLHDDLFLSMDSSDVTEGSFHTEESITGTLLSENKGCLLYFYPV